MAQQTILTPEIALTNLENATAAVQADRNTHALIMQSVEVLRVNINELKIWHEKSMNDADIMATQRLCIDKLEELCSEYDSHIAALENLLQANSLTFPARPARDSQENEALEGAEAKGA